MKYNLPKGYLSYSAMSTWWTSKEQYRLKYYSPFPVELDTEYTRFGKGIAETLEDKKKTKAHPVLSQIPLYPVREQPLEFEIDGVPIKGFIDSFDKRHKKIIEIKTGICKDGKKPWDVVRVRKHEQILLYSLGVKELFGKVNPLIKLIWLETAWREKKEMVTFGNQTFENAVPELFLTGHFEVFDRVVEDWEHDRMKRLIVKTAEEISADYTAYKLNSQ
jgi:hypothetical protein